MKICASCGKSGDFKSCGSCRLVSYCSLYCQKADWIKHKAECKYLDLKPPIAPEKLIPLMQAKKNLSSNTKVYDSLVSIYHHLDRHYREEADMNDDPSDLGMKLHQYAFMLGGSPLKGNLNDPKIQEMFFKRKYVVSPMEMENVKKNKRIRQNFPRLLQTKEEKKYDDEPSNLVAYQFSFFIMNCLGACSRSSEECMIQLTKFNADVLVRASCGSALTEAFHNMLRDFAGNAGKRRVLCQNGAILACILDTMEDDTFKSRALSFLSTCQKEDWMVVQDDHLDMIFWKVLEAEDDPTFKQHVQYICKFPL